MQIRTSAVFGALASLALLAACGSNAAEAGGGAGAGSGSGSGSRAIEVKDVGSLGPVLVTKGGDTVYFSGQEKGGKVACIGPCTKIWLPVTSSAADMSAPDGASGKLSSLKRPDNGAEQLTYNGSPLYTFSLDGGPGKTTGDGVQDSFGAKAFTWHAALASGGGSGTASSPSPYTQNNGGY